MMEKIVVLSGPTASGKTSLALSLAQIFPFEIVSADSMQVYKSMDIATAKATPEEQAQVPHHLLDVVEPWEAFSVSDYCRLADAAITDILSREKIPLICGGTGFYIKALIEGVSADGPGKNDAIRKKYEDMLSQIGPQALWELLCFKDPARAEAIHPNNTKRVIRALELMEETGKKASELAFYAKSPRYHALYLALDYPDRESLYRRIDLRVDEMMKEGLPDEARTILNLHLPSDTPAMQAIGYKEFLETTTSAEASELIKRRTRQYAKRQMTWLRGVDGACMLNAASSKDSLLNVACEKISAFLSH
ncbi:MAG: tRNA (adenosine(37)-N6)-dimethylallyltransferase MiaA [Ruminococcaceae bacterium]|nr:tRNA (adenosine(37)-N6)-dimethylallyltransferase MiaA [Oscillospiraceae bacterium]